MKIKLLRSAEKSSAAWLLMAVLGITAHVSGQQTNDNYFPDTNACIVVTGMKLDEDPKNYVNDPSVAEGAMVRLSMKNGPSWQKTTQVFTPARNTGEIYYTADFKVEFDSTYTIDMTFKNGTGISIDNYRIMKEWKTHFYFHSTNGTKSAASVMRRQEDKSTKYNCIVYGLYPLTNYKAMGGIQLTD